MQSCFVNVIPKQYEHKIYHTLFICIVNNKQRATLITVNYLHYASEKNEFTIQEKSDKCIRRVLILRQDLIWSD